MFRPARTCLALTILALLLLPHSALSWGTFTGPYCRLGSALPDGAGGVFVVWDYYDDNINPDIRGQRIDSNGNLIWAPNPRTICGDPAAQSGSAATTDGAGGVYVVWEDARSQSQPTGIYAQRLDGSGNALWAANGIHIDDHYSLPSIASDGAGGAIVAWLDNRSGNLDVWAQRIGPDGTLLWAPGGLQITSTLGNEGALQITGMGAGRVAFIWSTAGGSPLVAQAVDTTGATLWGTDGVPLDTSSVNVGSRALCSDGAAGLIVGWTGAQGAAGRTVRAQHLDVSGNLLWGAGSPVTLYDGTSGNATSVALAADGVGGAYVGYASASTAVQHLNADGSAAWASNGAVVAPASANEAISLATNGTYVAVAWTYAHPTDFVRNRLYGQLLDPTGAGQWTAGGQMVYSNPFFTPSAPVITPGASGYWTLVWQRNETSASYLSVDRLGDGVLGVDDPPRLDFALGQPRPNPMRSVANVRFTTPTAGPARLEVFDVAGRSVATLRNGPLPAGDHDVSWLPVDAAGHRLASGVYLMRLEAAGRSLTRRVVLVP